jgi:hypothetical protein
MIFFTGMRGSRRSACAETIILPSSRRRRQICAGDRLGRIRTERASAATSSTVTNSLVG